MLSVAHIIEAAAEGRQGGAGPEAQRAWLRRLPAASYAGLFKESLSEGTMLSVLDIVRTCAQRAAVGTAEARACAAFAREALQGLSSTRRFGMLLMFLDAEQKASVRAVFAELRRLGEPASSALLHAWEQKA